jgi:hypothetical protein
MHQMRKCWDQIGHVTCPTKHKCKSKNKKLSYKQAQHKWSNWSSNSSSILSKRKLLRNLASTNSSQPKCGSFCQLLKINTSWFKFWVSSYIHEIQSKF